ncbi:MAG: hypothetical protein P8080_07740 [Gammaproteobacteria bacterium]
MSIELEYSWVLFVLVLLFNVAVAAVAVVAAGHRGRSRRLAGLCAVLLGVVPPLNVVYLAALSLLPCQHGMSSGH